MSKVKANITKLDNGGYDVEFEGGGRVLLNEDEASTKTEAEKVARERYAASGRTLEATEDEAPATAETSEDEAGEAKV